MEEKIDISPEVLQWAFRRIEKQPGPTAPAWLNRAARWLDSSKQPTFRQVINFSRKAHLPLDYLLGDEPPPKAQVPIPDMRAIGPEDVPEPSQGLLDAIHLCRLRQEWYKGYLHGVSDIFCDFVGSASLEDSAEEVAASMRNKLSLHETPLRGSQEDRLKALTVVAETIGILVMRSSMIRNPYRMLKPEEFQGIALADEVDKQVPVIFINSAAPKSTLAFTFAHELAHIWLGKNALSGGEDGQYLSTEARQIEQWCHQVATQFLSPADHLTQSHHTAEMPATHEETARHTKLYKVSEPTADRYDIHKKESTETRRGGTTAVRIAQANGASWLVCRATIASLSEKKITFREAFELLDVPNTSALHEIGDLIGVPLSYPITDWSRSPWKEVKW